MSGQKKNVVYPHNGSLCGDKREQSNDVYKNRQQHKSPQKH